jgi:hypothetical protein
VRYGNEFRAEQQLETIELSFFRSSDERRPFRTGEDEDRSGAIVFRIANSNTIGLQSGYLNAATI